MLKCPCGSAENVVCQHSVTFHMYCLTCANKINAKAQKPVVIFPYEKYDTFIFTKSGVEVSIVENHHNGFYTVVKKSGKQMLASYKGLERNAHSSVL